MNLESNPSVDGCDPHSASIFLHGQPKLGKSEFFSKFNDVFFIATERGLGRLNVRKKYINDFQEFIDIVAYMKKEHKKGNFKAGYIVIDTVDLLYRHCVQHVLKELRVESIGDAAWGKGWALLGDYWIGTISDLMSMGIGIGFIGHTTFREVTVRGVPTDKAVPELPARAFNTLNAACDYIIYGQLEKSGKRSNNTYKEQRYIYLRGTPEIEAGSRDGDSPLKIELSYDAFIEYCEDAAHRATAQKSESDKTNTVKKGKKKKSKLKGLKKS